LEGKKPKYVNYMGISIPFAVITVIQYKTIPVSGWKCYLMGKHLNVPTVSENVNPPPRLLGLADSGSMREARGKRSLKIGTLLPNIVLYNDPTPHPSTTTTATVISADMSRKPDLLLIFGTSLKVHGIKKLVKDFAKQVHANKGLVILINKCALGKSEWNKSIDYWVEGDCDSWIRDLKTRIPNLWMKQEVLPVMSVIKPTPKKNSILRRESPLICVAKIMVEEEDKENKAPTTPRKSPRGPTMGTYQTAKGLMSPLSPSKRTINVDALESPTKRLHISSKEERIERPPRMNWAVAGKMEVRI
jgi:hypothetical protein